MKFLHGEVIKHLDGFWFGCWICRVVEEEIEVTVVEQCVEYEDVCVIRQEPKVITEECEEVIQVPVVKEVKVTKMCEEWTGK